MQNPNIRHPDLTFLVAVHTLIGYTQQIKSQKLWNFKSYTDSHLNIYISLQSLFFAHFTSNRYVQYKKKYLGMKSEHFNLQGDNTFDIYQDTMYLPIRGRYLYDLESFSPHTC